MKKIAQIAFLYFVEAVRLPDLIKSAYKILKYQSGFGASVFKKVILAVFADPVMFLLAVGIILGLYLDEIRIKLEQMM